MKTLLNWSLATFGFTGIFPLWDSDRQKIFRDTGDFEKSLFFFMGDFGGFFLVLLCFLSKPLDIKPLTQIF